MKQRLVPALVVVLMMPAAIAAKDATAVVLPGWRVLHFDSERDLDPYQVAPTQSGAWRAATREGQVSTARGILPEEEAGSIYAQTVVQASREADASLEFGFTGTCTAWWNNDKVMDFAASPGPPDRKSRKKPVHLSKGRNTLLLRIETDGPPARWCVRLRPSKP